VQVYTFNPSILEAEADKSLSLRLPDHTEKPCLNKFTCKFKFIYHSILKIRQWIHEILRQMDGSGGYHRKWGNSISKEHTWYAFTDKWILDQKLRIPKIQFANTWNSRGRETKVLILRRSYRDKVWSRPWRNDHPETAPPGDPPINNHQSRQYCRCQQDFADRKLI
jgi:hypothetical protein